MIKKFMDTIKNIEKDIYEVMMSGFKFSLIVCIISCIVSILYIINPISHILYDSGIILFKTGLTFGVMFFLCGFVIDNIKKQLI